MPAGPNNPTSTTEEPAFIRRTSYGPTSPTVGSRGARTRRQIVDAALRCFTEGGFHSTSVEEIAARADTSRATLYQYFPSKDSIFIELMYQSGGALIQSLNDLQPLGPTRAGLGNLQRWLGEFAEVFGRYAPMFIEWANVNSPQAPLRPKLAQFLNYHTETFGTVLRASSYAGPDPSTAAILVLAVTNRANYIDHVYDSGLSDVQLLDSLTTAMQLFLFPNTRRSVLSAPRRHVGTPARRSTDEVTRIRAELPFRRSVATPKPFEGRSPQASKTVRQLLDAAGRVFAASGYEAANVDLIITEAGLARGTFYRYFSDKLELITVLAHEAAATMCPMLEEFPSVATDPDPLRSWLHRFLGAQRRYTGVLRSWTEGFPIDPILLSPAADVTDALRGAVHAVFGPERRYPLERSAVSLMFAGLLEHFPNEGAGSTYEPNSDQIVEAQAQFVERVLLDRR